jgi:hypothetical protein
VPFLRQAIFGTTKFLAPGFAGGYSVNYICEGQVSQLVNIDVMDPQIPNNNTLVATSTITIFENNTVVSYLFLPL